MLLAVVSTEKPVPPTTAMLLMSREAVPVLLIVSIWLAELPRATVLKPRFAGLTEIMGTARPVPVRVTVVVVLPLLETTRLLAATTPAIEGAYRTVIVCVPFGAIVSGRVEVSGLTRLKSVLPDMVKELMVAGILPLFVNTTDSVLLVPSVTLPKASVFRLGVKGAAAPVPLRPTLVFAPLEASEAMVSVSVLSPTDVAVNCTST